MDDPRSVLTPELESRVRDTQGNGVLDVIVELADDPSAEQTVTAQRESFDRAASPVAAKIAELGGDVVDKAWINRTLHARVPARHVRDLGEHDSVTALDVPHRLTAE